MAEVWKKIPGYDDYYASDQGRIKSVKWGKTRIMKPGSIKGYLITELRQNGKGKKYKVHQLIAMAFLGHQPCGQKWVVDHIDDNKSNNKLENLQVVTQHRNAARKKYKKGTSKYVGVSWAKRERLWNARIYNGEKYESLGYFKSQFQAHLSYQERFKELEHGRVA